MSNTNMDIVAVVATSAIVCIVAVSYSLPVRRRPLHHYLEHWPSF